jgi:hypothetical protein
MSLKHHLARLERVSTPAGACPGCGHRPDDVRDLIVAEHGRGEPVAFYYQNGWPDYRPGECWPYPPDPRPLCPTCDLPDGPLLILCAVYEGESTPVYQAVE